MIGYVRLGFSYIGLIVLEGKKTEKFQFSFQLCSLLLGEVKRSRMAMLQLNNIYKPSIVYGRWRRDIEESYCEW